MEKVIIIGAGLSGILLAIILEKASIDYVVLERSNEAKMQLEGGGLIPIMTQIQPLLDQLGLLDQLKKMSKPVDHIRVLETFNDNGPMETIGLFDTTFSYSRHGEYTLAISRPELINFLIDQIPTNRILLGKTADRVEQDRDVEGNRIKGGARCICTDGSIFEGIIVGADGAYSNVRLNMYRHLKDKGTLLRSDRQPMKIEYRSLLGMTRSLDPERFPLVTTEFSEPRILISRGSLPFTIWCIPMTENRIYWMLDEPLPGPQDCPDLEDWSTIESEGKKMCQKYGMLSSPIEGVLLKELFDLTPSGIFALPREEGVFSTWSDGKVVLMGDACHKILPHGGQPFAQAGYDAVRLADLLYQHSLDPMALDISYRFEAYNREREGTAKNAMRGTFSFVRIINKEGWIGRIMRKLTIRFIPNFLFKYIGDRINVNRPQVEFMLKKKDDDKL